MKLFTSILVIFVCSLCFGYGEGFIAEKIIHTDDGATPQHQINFIPGTISYVNPEVYKGRVESGWVQINGAKLHLKIGATAVMLKETPYEIQFEVGSSVTIGKHIFQLSNSLVYLIDYSVIRLLPSVWESVQLGSKHYQVGGWLTFDKAGNIISSDSTISLEDVVLGGQKFVVSGAKFAANFDFNGNLIQINKLIISGNKHFQIGGHIVTYTETTKENWYDFRFTPEGKLISTESGQQGAASIPTMFLSVQDHLLALKDMSLAKTDGITKLGMHPESKIEILRDSNNNYVAVSPKNRFCLGVNDKVVSCPDK